MSTVVRLGHIALSFHQASTAVVAELLRNAGHNVHLSAAPHVQMFERFGRGNVDMLVSAWLPASHGAYLAPFLNDTSLEPCTSRIASGEFRNMCPRKR